MPIHSRGGRRRACELSVLGLALAGLLFCGCGRHEAARRPQTPPPPSRELGQHTDVVEVADADGAPAAERRDAPALDLRLDATEISADAPVTGTLSGSWKNDVLRLLWIDGLGRIVAAADLASPKPPEHSAHFSLNLPRGALGQQHRLAVVRAPQKAAEADKNGAAFHLETEAAFRVVRPSRAWDDYFTLIDHGGAGKSAPFWRKLQSSGIAGGFCSAAESATPLVLQDVPFFSEALPVESNLLNGQRDWAEHVRQYDAQRNDAKMLERQPALFDEAALDAAKKALEKSVGGKRSAQPIGWSLGDGLSVTSRAFPFDYDLSASTLDVFRGWLADRYRLLAALNQQWGANYATWKEVAPPTTDQAKAAQNSVYAERLQALQKPAAGGKAEPFKLAPAELSAPGRENFSAWSDFRAFSDFAFARVLREYRGWLRAMGESAPVGLVDAQAPAAFGGWDWWQLCKTLDWVEEHQAPFTRNLVRSFAPGMRCLTGLAGVQPGDRYRLWDGWLRGDAGCILTHHDRWLNPQTTEFIPDAQALAADLRTLSRGVTLLRNAGQAVVDPIAIYYSPRSIQLHWMLDSESYGSQWPGRDSAAPANNSALRQFEAWTMLLEDLGYTPGWLHPEQLLHGGLDVTHTKVLILPKVLSLSYAEARELREYVRAGGLIIADGECGTFDDSGKRRPQALDARTVGVLDGDFGIVRKDLVVLESNGAFHGDAAAARVTLRDAVTSQPIGPDSAELRVLEPGIIAAGAWTHAFAQSGAVALASRSGGLGRFIYLNLCLQDYPALREKKPDEAFRFHGLSSPDYDKLYGQPTGGEALRLVLSDILGSVLNENPLRVRGEDGLPLRGIKRTQFVLGQNASLFGLLPGAHLEQTEAGETVAQGLSIEGRTNVWVGLEKERHWYDVQAGQYLGQGKMVQAALEPHRAALLAALPYKVERLQLKVRRTDTRGAFKISAAVATDSGEPVRHVLRIDVSAPDGTPLPHYSQNIATEHGEWTGQIILGLNDPIGHYHLTVRDIISGKGANGDLFKESAEYGNVFPPQGR